MGQKSDTPPKDTHPIVEERVRRFVSAFKGTYGDIKHDRLEQLMRLGYTKAEAKNLYNFGENFAHLLPESKVKAPKTLNNFITKLILLVEAKPELAVALFGRRNEAIIASLLAEKTVTAKPRDEISKMMSHPGISGRKKTIERNDFDKEIITLREWFEGCVSLRRDILEILALYPGSVEEIYPPDFYKYCDFLLSFLKNMKKERVENEEDENQEENQDNKPKVRRNDIIRNAAMTAAYKYLREVAETKRGFTSISALFFKVDMFLAYIQINLLKELFIYIDKYKIKLFGYKYLYLKCECEGFEKTELYKTFENIIRVTDHLIQPEIFSYQQDFQFSNNNIVFYQVRHQVLLDLYNLFDNFQQEDKDVSDTGTEKLIIIPERFLVALKYFEESQTKVYEKIKEVFIKKTSDISQTYGYFNNNYVYLPKNISLPQFPVNCPPKDLTEAYQGIRDRLVESKIISYPEPPTPPKPKPQSEILKSFRAKAEKIAKQLRVIAMRLTPYVLEAEYNQSFKYSPDKNYGDTVDLSVYEYSYLYSKAYNDYHFDVYSSGKLIHISASQEKFWFNKTRLRQAKKDGILLWFDDKMNITHAERDDGLEIWIDELGNLGVIDPADSKKIRIFYVNIDPRVSEYLKAEKAADSKAESSGELIPHQEITQLAQPQPFIEFLDTEATAELNNTIVSLIEELSRTKFSIDIGTVNHIEMIEETAHLLYSDAVQLLPLLNAYGITRLNMITSFYSQEDDEDLTKHVFDSSYSISFKDKEYLIERERSGKLAHVTASDKEFWFENTCYGSRLRQGKSGDILIWFKDNSFVTHASKNTDLEVWLDESGNLSHMKYFGTGYWYDDEKLLCRQVGPNERIRTFRYNDLGLLSSVSDTKEYKKTEKEWEFTYYPDNKLAQIIDPDGNIISISQDGIVTFPNREIIQPSYPFEVLITSDSPLPEMKKDTSLLLEELGHIPLTVYEKHVAYLNMGKEIAEEMSGEVVQLVHILNNYGLIQTYLTPGLYNPADLEEDLSKIVFTSIGSVTFLGRDYFVGKNGKYVHAKAGNNEYWFEDSGHGLIFRQARRDSLLLWFKDNSILTHVILNPAIKAWFWESGYLYHINYDGYRDDWYNQDGKLIMQKRQNGRGRHFIYNDSGLLTQVEEETSDELRKEWEFYYRKDKLSQIVEPDGTIIDIDQMTISDLDNDQEPPIYPGAIKNNLIFDNRNENSQSYHDRIDRFAPIISKIKELAQELYPGADKVKQYLDSNGLF